MIKSGFSILLLYNYSKYLNKVLNYKNISKIIKFWEKYHQ